MKRKSDRVIKLGNKVLDIVSAYALQVDCEKIKKENF